MRVSRYNSSSMVGRPPFQHPPFLTFCYEVSVPNHSTVRGSACTECVASPVPSAYTAGAVQLPPWSNLWLLGSIALSMALHAFILYVPPAAAMFSVTALNGSEWLAVLWLSFPVILVDEVLKWITRYTQCSLQTKGCTENDQRPDH
jgi:hypothetical protein